jgi:hypothetical protein
MTNCVEAFLVGLDLELPTDPAIAYTGGTPIVGCNHIVCGKCGAEVRHADSRSTTSNYRPPEAELAKLYDSSDPGSSPLLDARPLHEDSRAYFCRCDWAAVDLGGSKSVGDVDALWDCGGHQAKVLDARDIRIAEAQKQVAGLVKAAVPVDPSGAKIKIFYAPNVNPEFATASGLRDALLASYPDAQYFGKPVAGTGRDGTVAAWGWVVELLRMRSDWHASIGISLQHAAKDGGELARIALADLLAGFRDTIGLFPWTSEMAGQWPDVRATTSGTGWGVPELTLQAIIRDQTKYLDVLKAASSEVLLVGYGKGGKDVSGPLTNEAELRALLDETARAGQSPDGDDGPWSWLGFELLTRDEWIRSAFSRLVVATDPADEPWIFALLDWFSEERDLWQLEPLLADWHADPPAWAKTSAKTKPKGWKRTMRSAHWPEVETLGDIARQALWRAKKQLATPASVDLPLLYGPSLA